MNTSHSNHEEDRVVEASPMPLVELVERALTGGEEDWRALVDRFTPLLRATTRRFGLNEVDRGEAIQATWVACFEHLGAVRQPAALPGWLATTCRRECLTILKAQERCSCVEEDRLSWMTDRAYVHVASAPDPADVVVATESLAWLHEAVDQLPDRQRVVVRELMKPGRREGYHHLADRLSMPVGSIGPTRQRAVRSLRSSLVGAA